MDIPSRYLSQGTSPPYLYFTLPLPPSILALHSLQYFLSLFTSFTFPPIFPILIYFLHIPSNISFPCLLLSHSLQIFPLLTYFLHIPSNISSPYYFLHIPSNISSTYLLPSHSLQYFLSLFTSLTFPPIFSLLIYFLHIPSNISTPYLLPLHFLQYLLSLFTSFTFPLIFPLLIFFLRIPANISAPYLLLHIPLLCLSSTRLTMFCSSFPFSSALLHFPFSTLPSSHLRATLLENS